MLCGKSFYEHLICFKFTGGKESNNLWYVCFPPFISLNIFRLPILSSIYSCTSYFILLYFSSKNYIPFQVMLQCHSFLFVFFKWQLWMKAEWEEFHGVDWEKWFGSDYTHKGKNAVRFRVWYKPRISKWGKRQRWKGLNGKQKV